MKIHSYILLIIIITTALSNFSCSKKQIGSVRELAEILQEKGINFNSIEHIDVSDLRHAKIDESIRLKGDNINIEIYRIEDKRTYELFISAGVFIFVVENESGVDLQNTPDNIFTHKPYIIVLKQEQNPGELKIILNEIF